MLTRDAASMAGSVARPASPRPYPWDVRRPAPCHLCHPSTGNRAHHKGDTRCLAIRHFGLARVLQLCEVHARVVGAGRPTLVQRVADRVGVVRSGQEARLPRPHPLLPHPLHCLLPGRPLVGAVGAGGKRALLVKLQLEPGGQRVEHAGLSRGTREGMGERE